MHRAAVAQTPVLAGCAVNGLAEEMSRRKRAFVGLLCPSGLLLSCRSVCLLAVEELVQG